MRSLKITRVILSGPRAVSTSRGSSSSVPIIASRSWTVTPSYCLRDYSRSTLLVNGVSRDLQVVMRLEVQP
jgi:hypothetical protein